MTIFHTIKHPDGTETKGLLSINTLYTLYQNLQMPDLTNKTVLDVGAAEGFYSLEFAKICSHVVSVNVELSFYSRCINSIIKSNMNNITPVLLSAYDVNEIPEDFDVVCMLGLIYHLKNPLLAIEQCTRKAKELVVIESHYVPSDIAIMKYYQYNELNNDYTNWWGPSILCIEQMLQTAGCKKTEVKFVYEEYDRVVVHGYK